MGWNSGFAKLEQDVIDCYNKGILSKEKLNEEIW